MNILDAMKHAKQGKIICIYGKEIYLNEKEELILLKNNMKYTPSLEEMLSNNWYVLDTVAGSVIKVKHTTYKILDGYRDRKYLLDIYTDTIVKDYENEELLNEDIRRMLCTE